MDGLTLVRAGVGVAMLAVAALLDLRARRVPNRFWWPFLGVAVAATVVDGARGTLDLVLVGLGVGFAAFVFALWWSGLFGGADAKGLMVLAVLVPVHPGPPPTTVFALDSLLHAALLSLAVPLALFLLNAAAGRWQGWLMFLGRPIPLTEARGRHVWPMQRVVDGVVVRRLRPDPAEDMDGVYAGLAEAGMDTVWVTPKIPFFVPLTVGAAVAWWQGDVVLAWLGM